MKSTKVTDEQKYHNQVADWYVKRNESDFIWQVPEELSLLTPKYVPTAGTIVDMGCGPCFSMQRYFEKYGHNQITYIGIDIAKNMLTYAKQNIPWGKYLVHDIERTQLNFGSIDCIVSLGALHHAMDQEATLQHWMSLMKSGGKILLREPTLNALPRGSGESPHEKGIDLEKLRACIDKNGGKIQHCQKFNTNAFHFFNKIAITLGLGGWRKYKVFWYPVTNVDFLLSKLDRYFDICTGNAFLLVIEKI